jgi:hypothetical protein
MGEHRRRTDAPALGKDLHMTHGVLRRVIIAVALSVPFMVLPASASAALVETGACDDAELTQPFAPWGDNAHYKLAPGGDIEGDLAGWQLRNGARTVADSNTHNATGERGNASLYIPAGGSVTTPASCVNVDYPTFRFFSKSSGGLLGLLPALKVELLYRDQVLGILPIPIGVGLPSSGWKPSMRMLTASAVGGVTGGGEAQLAYRFTSLLGKWYIDDVFVDPVRRG